MAFNTVIHSPSGSIICSTQSVLWDDTVAMVYAIMRQWNYSVFTQEGEEAKQALVLSNLEPVTGTELRLRCGNKGNPLDSWYGEISIVHDPKGM